MYFGYIEKEHTSLIKVNKEGCTYSLISAINLDCTATYIPCYHL